MKISSALLALLLPLAIAAAPTADNDDGHGHGHGHDNYISCKVYDHDAYYYRCPKTSCDKMGEYHKGHWEDFYCYKWNDNKKWYRDRYGYYTNSYWWNSCTDGWIKEC